MTSASDTDPDSRLVELEIRYAHASDLVRQLSDALYEQQKAIDRLTQRVAILEGRWRAEQGHEGAAPAEKPPHY